jgi:hypothetical protein
MWFGNQSADKFKFIDETFVKDAATLVDGIAKLPNVSSVSVDDYGVRVNFFKQNTAPVVASTPMAESNG